MRLIKVDEVDKSHSKKENLFHRVAIINFINLYQPHQPFKTARTKLNANLNFFFRQWKNAEGPLYS
jgi:hypothetical protein